MKKASIIFVFLCSVGLSGINVGAGDLDQKGGEHTIMPIGPPWENPVFVPECANWWYWTEGRTYTAVINGTQYSISLGESVTGPCPSGEALIEWAGCEALVRYHTTHDRLYIADEPFVIIHYRLIWIPHGLVVLSPDFPVAMPLGE